MHALPCFALIEVRWRGKWDAATIFERFLPNMYYPYSQGRRRGLLEREDKAGVVYLAQCDDDGRSRGARLDGYPRTFIFLISGMQTRPFSIQGLPKGMRIGLRTSHGFRHAAPSFLFTFHHELKSGPSRF